MNMKELATSLSERDGSDISDAMDSIRVCQSEVDACLAEGRIEDIEDALMDILGIEMDYLDIFL